MTGSASTSPARSCCTPRSLPSSGWALLSPPGSNWGENALTAGAIQATMVASLPLPPKQRTLDTGVLTSEAPSPAPVTEKEKTEPPPKPDELAIPEKTKPPKVAEKPRQLRRSTFSPSPVQPTKAVTGETAASASRRPRCSSRMVPPASPCRTAPSERASPTTSTSSTARLSQNWYTAEADPRASVGKSTTHRLRHQPRWDSLQSAR